MASSNTTASAAAEDESSSKLDMRMLVPQMIVGLIDAISFMIVAPSIAFYVQELGGSKENYGVVLSMFSFSSFLFKPILGYWSDQSGSKFRHPYMVSLAIASFGGALYYVASAFASTSVIAVGLVVLSRFLGGVGAANSTLGFTYMAQVIPHSQMTKATSLLSMVRVIGMAVAPGLNVCLARVDYVPVVWTWLPAVTPLNVIGLLLCVLNGLSLVTIHVFLEEPPASTKPEAGSHGDEVDERSWAFWKHVLSLDILVPIGSILSLNACFQILETCLAPASSDALGWTPVEVSTVFGVNALFIFAAILLTFQLSAWGVTDTALLMTGLVLSIVGYGLMYLWWSLHAGVTLFVVPIVLATMAFPFMGAPTRSIFTKTVASTAHLSSHQGSMQAILSMMASVAGFTAPGLIAAFVLRTPDEVRASNDQRELTSYALFAPISSAFVLGSLIYVCMQSKKGPAETDAESLRSEAGSLLSNRVPETPTKFHPRTESHRRHSAALMGIQPISFEDSDDVSISRNALSLR